MKFSNLLPLCVLLAAPMITSCSDSDTPSDHTLSTENVGGNWFVIEKNGVSYLDADGNYTAPYPYEWFIFDQGYFSVALGGQYGIGTYSAGNDLITIFANMTCPDNLQLNTLSVLDASWNKFGPTKMTLRDSKRGTEYVVSKNVPAANTWKFCQLENADGMSRSFRLYQESADGAELFSLNLGNNGSVYTTGFLVDPSLPVYVEVHRNGNFEGVFYWNLTPGSDSYKIVYYPE